MPRYIAFLRGISPTNATMSDLKRCFEAAGFTNVKTVLATGNVAFDSKLRATASIERAIEKAMAKELQRTFYTIVRSLDALRELIESDPYAEFKLPPDAK